MDLDDRAERSCTQDRSLLNDTNDCAWVTVAASSPALRAPASGLRDLTPPPSPKPDAGVPFTHSCAANNHGKDDDVMGEFPLDGGHLI
jgi:hypothetical protein